MTTHILMTGAGAPGAAGIIRCLLLDPLVKLTIADARPDAVGQYIYPDFELLPPAERGDFIPEITRICREKLIGLVMPLVTRELLPLAQNRELLESAGTRVMVSPAEAIALANNKTACCEFLQSKGIPVPKFFRVRTTEEFIHAAFELGHPQRSFTFKPSASNGSRGFRIVSDSIDESEQLFGQKPYNTYITYAHTLKILSSKPFPELLVSEYLPGDEYSVDCLADHGVMKLALPRLRSRMVNGISVQGMFVKDEAIIEYCGDIIRALGLHGNIGIQVKRTEKGEALLLEVNPRVQGTIVAGLGAGVNLPLLAVKQELGIQIQPSEMEPAWGTQFARHWTEVFYR
ncbi:MAG TPA: ATP-grasp domain-containing protein [Flavisolibacter sp.]|jgi:carbamoyl-phosphate synthase large subunit